MAVVVRAVPCGRHGEEGWSWQGRRAGQQAAEGGGGGGEQGRPGRLDARQMDLPASRAVLRRVSRATGPLRARRPLGLGLGAGPPGLPVSRSNRSNVEAASGHFFQA